MAVVRIKISDIGDGNDNFEIEAESFPKITDQQVETLQLTLAQYASLKIMEFVKGGLGEDMDVRAIHEKLLKSVTKPDKGFH